MTFREVRRILRSNTPSLLVVGRLGASALTLISAPVVARTIGPEGRGQVAAALALLFILPVVLSLGIPLEVRRISAVSDGLAVLRACRIICSLATIPASLLALALSSTIFNTFSIEGRLMAGLGVALTPLTMSWLCDLSVLVAHGRYRAVLLLQLAQPTTYVTLILLSSLLGKSSVATVLTANLAGNLVTFAAGVTLTRSKAISGTYSVTKLLRGATKFAGSSISEVSSNRLDQVLILPLLGAYQAGIYSVAVTVASIPLALGHALAASYFTPIARAAGTEREHLKAQAARAGLAMGIMSFPLCALASWIGIPVLFGAEFASAVPVAMVSLLGSVAMVAAFLYSMALAAEGKGVRMTIAQIIALVSAVTLLYLIGPRYEAIGAAAASSLSYVVLLVTLFAYFGVPLTQVIPSPGDFKGCIMRIVRSGEGQIPTSIPLPTE